jgi:hypothetical protein
LEAEAIAERGLVVFHLDQGGARCGGCGEDVPEGGVVARDRERTSCLECAELGRLVLLPSGDVALTRRATKHSPRSAVLLRWSRIGKRYERRGTYVDEEALARAEAECFADADARERQRARDAVRRERLDQEFVARFQAAILVRFPAAPVEAARTIAEHACLKGSGRVGRTAAAKEFDVDAVELAVRAHLRHVHTKYDALLAEGVARDVARETVLPIVNDVARAWSRARGS